MEKRGRDKGTLRAMDDFLSPATKPYPHTPRTEIGSKAKSRKIRSNSTIYRRNPVYCLQISTVCAALAAPASTQPMRACLPLQTALERTEWNIACQMLVLIGCRHGTDSIQPREKKRFFRNRKKSLLTPFSSLGGPNGRPNGHKESLV